MSRSAQEILEDARQLPPDEVNWLIENLLQQESNEAVEMIPGELVRAEMIASLSPQARTRLRV